MGVKIADVTIPQSNTSQSTTHSWLVSSSTLVPTKNAKSLTPLLGGTAKYGQDRDRCGEIDDVTIPYSNTSQSIKDSWFGTSSILVLTKNAKSLTPLFGGGGGIGEYIGILMLCSANDGRYLIIPPLLSLLV